MYLEKLVIAGFKSFAQPTTFVFDAPFVSIVGPNGSGKTNIADAMRWVMGEQALKLLRMEHMTDAIFSGSPSRPRLGLASVDLFINNEDHRLPLEYDTVVIGRRVTRGGESEYLINKNPVRLHDILLLLAQAHFGQKSYGVIGQGMITDIITANPQDRKGFFDEATGVKEFQIKRDQSINKLILVEENLTRVEAILKEIEPHLQSLRRQVKKLEKRQAVEEKLQTAQVRYYGSTSAGVKKRLKELERQREKEQAELRIKQAEYDSMQKEIDEIGREASRAELYHRLQREYNEITEKKNQLLKEQAIIQGRLEVEQERSGEIDLLWLKRQVDDMKLRRAQTQSDIEITEAAIARHRLQLQKMNSAQTAIDQDLSKIESDFRHAREQLQALHQPLTLPEVKQRLEELFGRQEQFLRELLATTSFEQFKHVQQLAQDVTNAFAEFIDEFRTERTEDIAAQQRIVQSLEERRQSSAAVKENLLREHTQATVAVATQEEKLHFLQTTDERFREQELALNNQIAAQHAEKRGGTDDTQQRTVYEEKQEKIVRQLEALDQEYTVKKKSLDEFNRQEEDKKQKLIALHASSRNIQSEVAKITNNLQTIEIEIAKRQTTQEAVRGEIQREVTAQAQAAIEEWTEERHDHDQLLIQIEQYKHQLELIGGIDAEIVHEYDETKQRFEFLSTQGSDLKKTIRSLEGIIDELDVTIKHQFDKSFNAINKNFTKYFHLLFGGGNANLELLVADPQPEPTEGEVHDGEAQQQPVVNLGKLKKKQRIITGIDITAHPPKKKLASIQALSGGEQALTAIALVCAIIGANTPPFVVLDEVEAALDEANSEKFAAIVKHLAKKTQFVIITHNRSTMQHADLLYGVTMQNDGTSKILSVKLTEAEQLVQQA